MVKTLGNNIVNAFTGGNPVKAIYTYGEKVWPISGPEPPVAEYYIKWTPSTAEGQFNIDGTTHNLSAFSGLYYWSTGIINENAFSNNGTIQGIETNATEIYASAFQSCYSLSQMNLSACSYIGYSTFGDCSSLSQISLPVCTHIGDYAFYGCSSLSQISLPKCSSIGRYAFEGCSSLLQISLPKCSYIKDGVFQSCKSLSQISLPICSSIGAFAFWYCHSLSQISLPKCSSIGRYAFEGCRSLSIITIGYSGVCSLGSSVFYNTQITSSTGSIYVPASLVNTYKFTSGWSQYSNRIFAIPS